MINQETTREEILQWISRPQYVPVKIPKLAQQIGILKEDLNDFRLLVKRMIKQGLLTYGSGHLVFPITDARRRDGQVTGHFRRNPAGYGFVKILQQPEDETSGYDRADDIYIAEEDMLDAASGDLVLVQLTKNQSRKGRSGVISKILERATRSFVGSYYEKNQNGWVEVDGKIFREPIHVGDAAAHRVKEGDKVVIEMERFPNPWRCGEGVITEIIGPRGKPETDTLSIIRQYNLPESFEDAVLAEARHQAEIFEEWEKARLSGVFDENTPDLMDGRENLTQLPILTIDPSDARDFDDAISVELLPGGNYRLGVHIADVSHFVAADSALDRSARDRGNSVYLPDRVIPMFPEILSNGLASLQPGKWRLTKSVFQELTPEGLCVDVHICDSVIESRFRLNYEQVDRFFEGNQEELPQEAQDMLVQFRKLASVMRKRREARGMLVLNLPEIRLILDVDGNVTGVKREVNTESHQMIEEFMVSTNEAVAQTLADENANVQRRVHRPPLVSKIDALTQFLAEMGVHLEDGEDRFQLQKLLKKTAGTENEFAVHQAVLRSMQRAEYSPEEEGHYALASECYAHFTSPIRRYADLTVHRQLEAFLREESPKRNYRRVFDEGKHLSFCEQRAEEAERELTRIKMLNFFKTQQDLELMARIVGVARYGIFVQCEEYPLEGIIRLESLPPDDYRFSAGAQVLSGARRDNFYRLGDKVLVKINTLDTDRREISFRLLKLLSGAGAMKPLRGGLEGNYEEGKPGDEEGEILPPRYKKRRNSEGVPIQDPHLPSKFQGGLPKAKKKSSSAKKSGKRGAGGKKVRKSGKK
ncbi:MAG: ribonuclease R [Planctomycetia bacterium]|nr:ribonuclease R [Planctomycetia bacterium]